MYLRAARSMAAFAGMCDGGSTDDGCHAASMDDTTINALDTLHRNNYDTGFALQELVRRPVPRSVDKKWTDDESKRFVRGLKQHGKNFFKIQKDYLPFKDTGDLIEYYYFWKKTPAAANNRPHRRPRKGNNAAFRKQQRTPQPQSDLSSVSSDNDTDDSRDSGQLACSRCESATSKEWHRVVKDKTILCSNCCATYKKFNDKELIELVVEPPSYMFKPVNSAKAQMNGDGKHSLHNVLSTQDLKKYMPPGISPDNIDSAIDSSSLSSKDIAEPKSPSSNSITSNSSSDKDIDKKPQYESNDLEVDKLTKKSKLQGRSSSPTESSSGSSSSSDKEDEDNDGDIENNHDDISSSGSSSNSPSVDAPQNAIPLLPPAELHRTPPISAHLVPAHFPGHLQGLAPGQPYPGILPLALHPVSSALMPTTATVPSSESGDAQSSSQQTSTESVGPSTVHLSTTKPSNLLARSPMGISTAQTTVGYAGMPVPPGLPATGMPPTMLLGSAIPYQLPSSQLAPPGRAHTDLTTASAPIVSSAPSDSNPLLPLSRNGQGKDLEHLHKKLGHTPPPRSPTTNTSMLSESTVASNLPGLNAFSSHVGAPNTRLPLVDPEGKPSTLGGLRHFPTVTTASGPSKPSTHTVPSTVGHSISTHPHEPTRSTGLLANPLGGEFPVTIKTEPGSVPASNNTPSDAASVAPNPRTHVPFPPPALTSQPPVFSTMASTHPSQLTTTPGQLSMANMPPAAMQRLPTPPPLTQTAPNTGHAPHPSHPTPPPNSVQMVSGLPGMPPQTIKQEFDPTMHRPRSRSPIRDPYQQSISPRIHSSKDDDSDSNRGTPSPGPDAKILDEELFRSEHAIFVKHLSRGYNSCSRSDLQFQPVPQSKLFKKREDRLRRQSSSSAPIKEERRDSHSSRTEDDKLRKRPETPPANTTADAQVTSNVVPAQPLPPYSNDRHTPARMPYIGGPHDPTPALRQLSEYARPHTLAGQEPARSLPYNPSLPPHMDPVLHYRMASMYPPGSRERLELDLQRDKQERDQREREIRERDIREMEYREKIKQEIEMKPPGFDRLPPGTQLDPQWLEIQRRYGGLPPGPGHIPGVYPPSSLASDLIQRERERIDRIGAERLSAERIHAERLAMTSDYVARIQMATGMTPSQASQAAAAAAAHNTHTHAHAHTHLHLHQPGQEPGGIIPSLYPGGQPGILPPGFPPGGEHIPGAPPPPGLGPHLPPGISQGHLMNAAAAREQELVYRDLMNRAPYNSDPLLAQQLTAQAAAAQQEAIQRIALERERERLGGPPMH